MHTTIPLFIVITWLLSSQIAFQQLALQKIQSIGKLPRGIPEVFKDAVKNLTEYIIAKYVLLNIVLLWLLY